MEEGKDMVPRAQTKAERRGWSLGVDLVCKSTWPGFKVRSEG